MSNIHQSILEKLTALNIDIYHYEDIVRCYDLAKLNIEHSQKPDYTDGIHTAEFTAEATRYQLLPTNVQPYYESSTFFSFCSELVSAGMDKDCRLFFEACAVDYGDIKPMQTHPDCPVIWIYKTTGYDTSAGKLGGKTRNADRIIPVPDKVAALIDERCQHIESQLGTSIQDYPIVCNNDRWDVRCSARELTNVARILFQSIKIKVSPMASISEELQDDPISQKDSLPFEDRKDPTAYLFRRNFGTHLHILGLSEPEIEYVIGHDIEDPYETRNEFVNEKKLFTIKQKMDGRPLVNSELSETEHIDAGEWLQLQRTGCVQIPVDSAETEMHITANEPTDNI